MRRFGTLAVAVGSVVATCVWPAWGVPDRTITGTIRDFNGSFSSTSPFPATATGHPHFEIFTFTDFFAPSRIPSGFNIFFNPQIDVTEPGIVAATLGVDGKPVWVGGSGANPQAPFATTKTKVSGNNLVPETDDNVSRTRFNQWYNDTAGVNLSAPFNLTLTDADNDGVLTYSNADFFPIDNQLLGNEGRAHNQHFTIEFHDTLTYQPGQTFNFIGGDDLWVFINGQLVIDLGGVHRVLPAGVNLDALGLTPGNTYPIDIFYAERNTFGADIQIQTNIPLGAVPEPGTGLALAGAAAVLLGRFRRA
jgi:fibro-slime domain-containing protein